MSQTSLLQAHRNESHVPCADISGIWCYGGLGLCPPLAPMAAADGSSHNFRYGDTSQRPFSDKNVFQILCLADPCTSSRKSQGNLSINGLISTEVSAALRPLLSDQPMGLS